MMLPLDASRSVALLFECARCFLLSSSFEQNVPPTLPPPFPLLTAAAIRAQLSNILWLLSKFYIRNFMFREEGQEVGIGPRPFDLAQHYPGSSTGRPGSSTGRVQ